MNSAEEPCRIFADAPNLVLATPSSRKAGARTLPSGKNLRRSDYVEEPSWLLDAIHLLSTYSTALRALLRARLDRLRFRIP